MPGDINITEIPDVPGGYDLTGKKIMIHDQSAPITSSTKLISASALATATVAGFIAPMWLESDGDMTAGSNDFTDASLIGATQMNYIIVNKVIEFIDEDYSFNSGTGTITRVNEWQIGDKMITPHKPA